MGALGEQIGQLRHNKDFGSLKENKKEKSSMLGMCASAFKTAVTGLVVGATISATIVYGAPSVIKSFQPAAMAMDTSSELAPATSIRPTKRPSGLGK